MKKCPLSQLLLTASFLVVALSAAQADDFYGINNGSGGPGTWQDGNATTLWYDFSNGTPNNQWNNSLQNAAYFGNGGTGTVNVVGNVSTSWLEFGGGDYTLSGTGTIDRNSSLAAGGLILQEDNNSNVTIDTDIVTDTAGNTDRFNIVDYGANNTVDFEGTLKFTDSTTSSTPYRSLIFNANGANDTFILNGVDTSGSTKAINIRFNEGSHSDGKLVLKGDYTSIDGGDFIDLAQGTIVLATSQTPAGKSINLYNGGNSVYDPHVVLTQGAQTITNSIGGAVIDYSSLTGTMTVGSSTADLSTYSGTITPVVTNYVATAFAGSRVEFTGVTNGSTPGGLVKTGTGTIDLANDNTYGLGDYYGHTGTVAADIQQGTVLINNPSVTAASNGSAFGSNSGIVKIEAGTTLGGAGSTSSLQNVVAVGATSVIAPGDPGYHSAAGADIASSIGTLHLNGGLTAASGLTMDFKLNGTANDSIDFGGSALTLHGVVTINLTGTPTINGTNDGKFRIWTGMDSNASDINGATYNIVAPTGYTVVDFGPGYVTSPNVDGFVYVQLAAVPEPSTYALFLLGGGGGLLFLARRRVNA